MVKFLSALLLVVAFIAPSCKTVNYLYHSATPISEQVSGSVVRLTSQGQGSCTGFVIAPERVITAAHCISETTMADGLMARVLKVDEYYDLALLEVKGVAKTPLELRDRPVDKFEMLIGIGYGYGWRHLSVLDEKVIMVNYAVDKESPVGIIVQGGYIGGMSGGPVVDLEGHIVGIVQRSAEHIGYGVGAQFIKAFLLGADVSGQAIPTSGNDTQYIGKFHRMPYREGHGE